MDRITLYSLLVLFSLKGWTQNGYASKSIKIIPSSELSITGDTNVSSFKCNFNTFYLEQSRAVEYQIDGEIISFKNALLTLKNEGFDCGNKAINKDFHSLLNTREYPKITLELTEITLGNTDSGNAYVVINIAGKEKIYRVPVSIASGPTQYFKGKLMLDIRDFGLQPPKKLMGLVVIKKEIEINFKLLVI